MRVNIFFGESHVDYGEEDNCGCDEDVEKAIMGKTVLVQVWHQQKVERADRAKKVDEFVEFFAFFEQHERAEPRKNIDRMQWEYFEERCSFVKVKPEIGNEFVDDQNLRHDFTKAGFVFVIQSVAGEDDEEG